jgi:RNA polymerase sigma-70 factor (ECF subfamily)
VLDAKARNLSLALLEMGEKEVEATSAPEDFVCLYKEYQNLVRAVIFQISGPEALDDLVQEAFIKIWTGLPQFRKESKFSSWVYRVSVNRALDYLRSQKQKSEVRFFEATQAGSDFLEIHVSQREMVSKGLQSLTEEHRTVLVLSLMHDLSISEIAEIVEISEGTIKSRLHYAKIEFREYLAKNGVEL